MGKNLSPSFSRVFTQPRPGAAACRTPRRPARTRRARRSRRWAPGRAIRAYRYAPAYTSPERLWPLSRSGIPGGATCAICGARRAPAQPQPHPCGGAHGHLPARAQQSARQAATLLRRPAIRAGGAADGPDPGARARSAGLRLRVVQLERARAPRAPPVGRSGVPVSILDAGPNRWRERVMFLRNCWYVIAWDHEIPRRRAVHPHGDRRAACSLFRTCRRPLRRTGRPLLPPPRAALEGPPRRRLRALRLPRPQVRRATAVCVEVPGLDRVPPKARVRRPIRSQ